MTQRLIKLAAPLDYEYLPALQWMEVASSFQIPSFHIIGLPNPEVAEAKDRVRSAIEASGFEFPRRRIVLNLSPASIKKRGTGIDLAMALAILAQSHVSRLDDVETSLTIAAWGELGLDGSVKPAGKSMRAVYGAWRENVPYLLISEEEGSDFAKTVSLLGKCRHFPHPLPQLVTTANLRQGWNKIKSRDFSSEILTPVTQMINTVFSHPKPSSLLPLKNGLERIIGVTTSGFHHLLLLGPKGVGKSHVMEWITHLAPPLDPDTKVRNLLLWELGDFGAGFDQISEGGSPVRRVGPQSRPAALLGNITSHRIRPGEFSLANGGVLVGDEFLEWHRDTREALRDPLERGKVSLTQVHGKMELPAQFLFVGTGNLCPCGGIPKNWPSEVTTSSVSATSCRCPLQTRKAYLQRLSGPILDRIDITLAILGASETNPSPSEDVSLRVDRLQVKQERTRRRMISSWGRVPGLLSGPQTEDLIRAHSDWQQSLHNLKISTLRSRHKILRVALSLSAWDEQEEPAPHHFAEAACYRSEQFFA